MIMPENNSIVKKTIANLITILRSFDFLQKSDVVDNLSSTNSDVPLSAKQGKVLNDLINGKVSSSSLSTVATSGDYDDLLNKPNIPSNTSDLTNDSGFITSSSVPSASSTTPSADTLNGSVGTGVTWARSNHTHPKSSLYAEASHTHSQYLTAHQDITGKEDKSNKVTSLSSSSTDTQYPSAKAVYDAIFSLDTLDCINENFTLLSLPQIIITFNKNSFDGSLAYILSSYGERAYVDWGDSTPIETYDKNDILEHEYSDNIQEHTIIIYGNIDGGSLYDASFRGLSGATSINIPSAVHSMEGNIFSECTGLTSVNLPQELTNIWSNTFSNCINLNTIILNWTELPPIGYSQLMDGSFGMNSTFSISIPYGTTSLYENAGYPTEKLVERSE